MRLLLFDDCRDALRAFLWLVGYLVLDSDEFEYTVQSFLEEVEIHVF